MILEIAQIEVKPGHEAAFEEGVGRATAIFRRAKGCRGLDLHRSIEHPTRYRLMVKWDTLENHTVDFRQSPDFQEWRSCVADHFAAPPEVEHTAVAVAGF
ncbi:MAG: antibiotic biosynthesis monooxygenase [Methylobacterium sp.]|uniref:antibiotic biosynthesis monooxygenase family protein n=1 Tax=Methylobacterium sp. TaxID=409 RepID=UPI002586D465|nr:antibiotic biosynthesis monooxygenase family protein [Methylobacterium sp.]MBY0299100.1 antibiotic biosynthesis monooxygenase [Methylobacterium sp.]